MSTPVSCVFERRDGDVVRRIVERPLRGTHCSLSRAGRADADRSFAERRVRRLRRAAAKAEEAVVALGQRRSWRKRALRRPARVANDAPRSTLWRAERTAASSRATGPATKPGYGPEGARRPLPDVAPAEAAARALVRRRLPLDLARQAAAGPAAPGVGLVPARRARPAAPAARASAGRSAAAARRGAAGRRGAACAAPRAAARPSRRRSSAGSS